MEFKKKKKRGFIIIRFYNGEIKNEIPTKEGSMVLSDFPEQPLLLTADIYSDAKQNLGMWLNCWKLEHLEKLDHGNKKY